MHSYLPQHPSYGPKIKRNTINPNIYRFVQSSFRLCQKIKTEVISTNKKKKNKKLKQANMKHRQPQLVK